MDNEQICSTVPLLLKLVPLFIQYFAFSTSMFTTVLQDGLQENFSTVEVSVVDCPDLTQKPFNLSAKGDIVIPY